MKIYKYTIFNFGIISDANNIDVDCICL